MSPISASVLTPQFDALELLEHSPTCVKLAAVGTATQAGNRRSAMSTATHPRQAATDLHLHIEASAPGVYRLRCGPAALLVNAPLTGRAKVHADSLIARAEAVGEFTLTPLPLPVSPGDDADSPRRTGWRLEQGDSSLDILCQPFALSLRRKGKRLLSTVPQAALSVQADPAHWQMQWALDVDDGLYGLGETGLDATAIAATAQDLDRRGQWLDSDAQPLLPLLWSVRGWGLYAHTWGAVQHDLGHTDADTYCLHLHDTVLDVFLFAGEPGEILNQYTALTGRAGQPLLWPMGVWLDQAAGTSTQAVLETASALRRDHFAFDSVLLAPPACYGFQADKPALEWQASRLLESSAAPEAPDSAATLSAFAHLHVQLAAPTLPVVQPGTSLFEEWEDRGWLLCRDDGTALVLEGDERTGGRPFALLDLTHKDAWRLWSERQRQMMDEGLGAPVCNARFAIPDDVTARAGEHGARLRALYPALARQALFEAVAGHKTPQEGLMLSRDIFPAAQRYAWQLGPQVPNTWTGLAQSLRAALAVGHAGIALQTHRLGCADTDTQAMTAELYLRWLAVGVFSGNFSFQASPALLPQAFDDSVQALVRHWLGWRYRLIPYILGIVEDAVRTGLPVQRSMALCYPDDPMAQVWDTQYLLGPALLVAPVLQPGTEQRVYLPKGDNWWDVSTGHLYAGGTTLTLHVGLDSLPVFGRDGHMLCLGPGALHTGEFNTARLLEEVWMFGMPEHSPVVMRNKIRVMQMQGSSYIKGLEGLRILPSEGLEVKRRGAEVRISKAR